MGHAVTRDFARCEHEKGYCLRSFNEFFERYGLGNLGTTAGAWDKYKGMYYAGSQLAKKGYVKLDNNSGAQAGDFVIFRGARDGVRSRGHQKHGHIGMLVSYGGNLRLFSNWEGTVRTGKRLNEDPGDPWLNHPLTEVWRYDGGQ